MIKNLFEGVKNFDFVGEAVCDIVGLDVKIKTIVLEELDTDRWNALAERTNTKSFIRMTGKLPKDYAEVQAWVRGLVPNVPVSKESIEKAAAFADATAQ